MFPYNFLNKKDINSRKIKKLFEESVNLEFLDKELIVDYQKKKIKSLLKLIGDIPFYSQYLKSSLQPMEVLQRLPIVDKKIILDNFELMQNKNSSQKFEEINTSGTSGTKGRFIRTEDCRLKWFAHTLKIWVQNNVNIEKKHAFIINRLSKDPRKNKSYFVNLIKNCNHVALSISCDLDFQIKWLKKEKPSYLTTFPTNLEHMFNKGYTPEAEHIFTYGEPFNRDFQKEFESQTKIKITDFYSTTEAGIIAQQCEYGNYHINSDNYFVEILKNQNEKIKNGADEAVITVFSNQTLPLIRYNIGDYVYKKDEQEICECGRKSDFFNSIIGRKNDRLHSKTKKEIWANDIINYLRKIKTIKKFQITQNKAGNITINYVALRVLGENNIKNIKQKMKGIIDNNIKIKQVRNIEREESGKFPLIKREFN